MNSAFTVYSPELLHTVFTVVASTTATTLLEIYMMKTPHAIFAIALSAASIGGAAYAVSSTDTASVATTQTESWLKIPAIYDKVIAAGYSDINEIEREDKGYEVKARNADGEKVKLDVDPVTGEVLKSRLKQD